MIKMTVYDEIVMRLKFFKYTVKDEDVEIIEYLMKKVLNSINNITNQEYTQETIPTGLVELYIDKVVGEFLMQKKTTGELVGIDLSSVSKSMSVGKIKVEYAIDSQYSNPDKIFIDRINYLIYGRDNELYKYRRMRW
ncbi:hypothetical protein [Fusobacterium varium]|uniref:hypothetical protein n=1 Tax=Fusobacterium varium TaxID=856 RepID=UPI0030CC24E6